MSREDDRESAPRPDSGADKTKKNKKRSVHLHIGPNARAYRSGRAACPVCDAEKIIRITERERELERLAKESMKRLVHSR